MKVLETRQEIAKAINIDRLTVIRIDLADADSYGLVSQPVNIDGGLCRDGVTPRLIRAELRVYNDTGKFTFSGHGACIHSGFTYGDMEDMITMANAPVVKKDSDIVICVVNSKTRKACSPIILHTGKRVDCLSSSPLGFDDDATVGKVFLNMLKK